MSGIGAISGYALYSTSNCGDTSAACGSKPSESADPRQAELDQALKAAGVSDETRAALEGDLESAFEEQLASGSPPDPEEMKQTIDEIFQKYGLDANDFMGRMRPGGPPPGGGMGGPQGSEDSDQTDLLQELLDSLANESEQSDGDTGTSALELAQQVLDILLGFDAEA